MSFILETLTNPTEELLTQTISQLELSDHKNSPCYDNGKSEEIEKSLLTNIISHAVEKKSRLHILYDERSEESIPCALIALNFEIVGSFSALCVDFIFISKSYRGKVFEEINSKISFYLLNFTLQEAIQMNEISQLDAVILTPINECVKEIYIEFGFEEFDDGWMYLLIDDIQLLRISYVHSRTDTFDNLQNELINPISPAKFLSFTIFFINYNFRDKRNSIYQKDTQSRKRVYLVQKRA